MTAEDIEADDFTEVFQLLGSADEKGAARRVQRLEITGFSTNGISRPDGSKTVPEADHVAWLRTAMASGSGGRRWPTDQEFRAALVGLSQYGRSATRHILERLERSFEHKEPVALDNATIEHVLPQDLTEEWKGMLGEHATETHAQVLHRLGNLTLTGYNSEPGNLPFAEKKRRLSDSHIDLNRWICEQDTWTAEVVARRGELLADRALTIFPGPGA